MDINQRKEQFSLAYIHAVVSVAGYALSDPRVDDDSIDVTILSRQKDGRVSSPRLDVQVKCTSSHQPSGGQLTYPLPIKNYRDLIEDNLAVPRLLIVVCVPENGADWIHQTTERLEMRRCGYWLSLRGMEPSASTTTCSVRLPETNIFSVEQITQIMTTLAQGELL
jgi:Domain of unknown function (DUF4365)